MALVYTTSFEDLTTAMCLFDGWSSLGAFGGVVNTQAFTGTYSLQSGAGSISGGANFISPAGSNADGYAGFWVRFSSAPGSTVDFMGPITVAGGPQIGLARRADRKLVVRRGSTEIVTPSTQLFSLDTWYWIEAKWKISNTAGEVQVKVDGVDWIPFTNGLNTRNSGSSNIFEGWGFCGGSGNSYFDDLILEDGTAPVFKGQTIVLTLFPEAANGTYTDWTPNGGSVHGDRVRENPGQDGDTTYVASDTLGDQDSYTLPVLGATGTIYGVQVPSWAAKDVAGDVRGYKNLIRTGGADFLGATEAIPAVGSYTVRRDTWETNPNTAVAWTPSDIDALEIGAEITTGV